VIQRTATVIDQARIRLTGGKPDSATRLVSLHDPDARPIVKGRLGRPIEFGYKAQIVDNADGIVLDHTVEPGNPPDAPQLLPAIERISRRTGQTPHAVTADRGYGEARVETDLHDAGVTTVAIPRKGRPGTARQTHERQPGFRRLVKWRHAGDAEGYESQLRSHFTIGLSTGQTEGQRRSPVQACVMRSASARQTTPAESATRFPVTADRGQWPGALGAGATTRTTAS
jgi:IS5 family transposase